MWTRPPQHSCPAPRYQTDLTDAEWRLTEPHLLLFGIRGSPCLAKQELINAIFYVLLGGILAGSLSFATARCSIRSTTP
jgi:hypothetical protein